MKPTVQWKGDNAQEIEHLLRDHVARADKDGERCRIIGLEGLNITLELGDSVVIEGERLGVLRAKADAPAAPQVTWKGENLAEVATFLKAFKVRIDVVGVDLFLYDGNKPRPIVLHRGDQLILRHGQIVISQAGKDHRV